MKTILCCLLTLVVFASCTRRNQPNQSVNPVIGDAGYEAQYGCMPNSATDDKTRIRAHFAYVEKLLRKSRPASLSAQQATRRNAILDLLHSYAAAGVFPRNYDYPDERRPCFIDKDGTICAVGYLIEQTSGRAMAEAINAKHKYDEVLAMKEPAIYDWLRENGLEEREAAMIQPSYGPVNQSSANQIPNALGIGSAALGGVNVGLAAINMQTQSSDVLPIMGLVGGAGQITLGVLAMPEKEYWNGEETTNQGKKAMSFINIGIGTATMFISGWRLAHIDRNGGKRVSLNLSSMQDPSGQGYAGLQFVKRF